MPSKWQQRSESMENFLFLTGRILHIEILVMGWRPILVVVAAAKSVKRLAVCAKGCLHHIVAVDNFQTKRPHLRGCFDVLVHVG